MRKRLSKVVAVAALLSFLLPMIPAEARAGDRLSETRRQLRAARAKLTQARQTDAQLLATIGSISSQLSTVQGRLSALRSRLAAIEARIDGAERHMAKLDAKRQSYAAGLGRRARQLYIMGPAQAEAWLASEDFGDLIGRATSIEFATRFDKRAVETLSTLRHQQTVLRRSLIKDRTRLVSARNDVAEQASLVSDVLDTHREAENALARRIAAFRAEVNALAAQERQIVALILARSSVYTGAISRSGFAWPIRGQITSPYGPRWGGYHTGIDIDCRTGDRIGASKAGRVIAAEWGGGYGNMVIIDHGNGVTTLYAHNSRLLVSQGQYVNQRQSVSLCGSTGNSTGDHLHFEVRVNGQHQNPRNFLP